MRLIDADKLLENYKKWIPQLSSKEDEGDRRGVETCIAVLEDAPTVDAVAVVRCCQCKNGIVLQHSDSVVCYIGRMPKMGFCSYGEHK